jgi:Transposase DDE domain
VDLDTFIVTIYCLIDDLFEEVLQGSTLRSRGPKPTLDDREVLTIEVVGEFLSIDTDKGIFSFFAGHYAEWFPKLPNVDRTTFTRQAANLWKVKKLMWKALLARIEHEEAICLVDSFAMPVCSFAKAPRHRSFAGIATRGYDAMSRAVFYGFEGHLRVAWPGVVVEASLAPADEHDRWVGEYDLLGGVREGTFVVGDTNYWSPLLREDLAGYGVRLIAPKKTSKKRDRHPWPKWLTNARRHIETVISQLVERYGVKRVRARDRWHLSSRFFRKVLGHTICVHLCQRAGLSSPRCASRSFSPAKILAHRVCC